LPLDRGGRSPFEYGGLMREGADARGDGRRHERPAGGAHARVPSPRGGPVTGAGDDEHAAAADEEDGGGEMDPAHEETEDVDASQRHRMYMIGTGIERGPFGQ
jgi:hypothetical protein